MIAQGVERELMAVPAVEICDQTASLGRVHVQEQRDAAALLGTDGA